MPGVSATQQVGKAGTHDEKDSMRRNRQIGGIDVVIDAIAA
jgi:hypothetical protein